MCLCLDVHVPKRHRKAYLIPRILFIRETPGLRAASLQSYSLVITVATTKGTPAAAASALMIEPAGAMLRASPLPLGSFASCTTGTLPLKVSLAAASASARGRASG